MNARQVLSASIFIGLSGVALSGCNFIQQKISEKITEQVVENASGGKFDIDTSENEYTITTEEGSIKVGSQDISAVTAVVDLPDWIVGTEKSGVMSSESDGKQAVYASLVSSRSMDETYAYWTQYFTDKGYENVTKTDYAGNKVMSGSMGENRETTLAITLTESEEDDINGVVVVVVYSGPAD